MSLTTLLPDQVSKIGDHVRYMDVVKTSTGHILNLRGEDGGDLANDQWETIGASCFLGIIVESMEVMLSM